MLVNQRVTGGENTIYQHLLHLPASEEMGIQRDLLFRKKEVATAPGRSDFFLFADVSPVSPWCNHRALPGRLSRPSVSAHKMCENLRLSIPAASPQSSQPLVEDILSFLNM